MAKFTFSSPNFDADECKSFSREIKFERGFTPLATKRAVYAAQNKLSDLATRMHIESKRPWDECLKFVMDARENAAVLTVSQMLTPQIVGKPESYAEVDIVDRDEDNY